MDGLRIAGGAIQAAQAGLDVTANNLANLNTPGFRADTVHYQTGPGGRGVEVGAISETTFPGPVSFTGRTFELSAEGNAFFAVRDGSGRLAFTRDGSFQLDAQGRVVTPGGKLLDPPVTVPRDATGVQVGRDGTVTAVRGDGSTAQAGRIRTVTFANPEGLSSAGGNLYVPSANSGAGRRAEAGIQPGMLELSNTDIATEMVNLIRNENFSKVGVVVARTEDETLGTVLDLKS
jgi:flagellar basal-body rod protein FlgG